MTPKYYINPFWPEADGGWVADAPDLQSCAAFSNSPAEALTQVEKAMNAWLTVAREDRLRVPEPRYQRLATASSQAQCIGEPRRAARPRRIMYNPSNAVRNTTREAGSGIAAASNTSFLMNGLNTSVNSPAKGKSGSIVMYGSSLLRIPAEPIPLSISSDTSETALIEILGIIRLTYHAT